MTDQEPYGPKRNVVITGASGGIGFYIARALLAHGHDLTLVARDSDRGRQATERLAGLAQDGQRVTFEPADLTHLQEVHRLADRLLEQQAKIDVLVNNAGRYVHDFARSDDGFETTFALNHLAPFVLTHRLMPALNQSDAPTVVTTASMAERVGPIDLERFASGVPYSAWRAYGWSKQANVHFARELARRAPHIASASFHPGFVATGFGHSGGGLLTPLLKGAQRLFGRTPEQGADTGAWLAAHPQRINPNGGYFVDRDAQTPSKAGRDDTMAAELWRRSEAWAGLDDALKLNPA